MSKPTRGNKQQPPGRSVDIAERTLKEFEEVQRRKAAWQVELEIREHLERLVPGDRDA